MNHLLEKKISGYRLLKNPMNKISQFIDFFKNITKEIENFDKNEEEHFQNSDDDKASFSITDLVPGLTTSHDSIYSFVREKYKNAMTDDDWTSWKNKKWKDGREDYFKNENPSSNLNMDDYLSKFLGSIVNEINILNAYINHIQKINRVE
tara:strand:- start:6182 stop:6631 length:450 start_codon:yes stop_codon:yes gene_type:complete